MVGNVRGRCGGPRRRRHVNRMVEDTQGASRKVSYPFPGFSIQSSDAVFFRGYYDELVPVSNYREWRERQATKLLRSTTSSSVTPSRRGSGSQQSAIPMYEGPESSSPASSRD